MIITDPFTKSEDSDCHKKGIKSRAQEISKSLQVTHEHFYFCIIVQS